MSMEVRRIWSIIQSSLRYGRFTPSYLTFRSRSPYPVGKIRAIREGEARPGKWTPRVLLGHVVDSHIIVAFRILSFGRGEARELPGADEDLWAALAGHERMPLADLVRGYRAAAATTDWIVGTLPPEAMERTGVANGILLTVRELHAYIIGHERHHRRILAERYGL